MTATAAMISRVRRITDENTDETYSDSEIQAIIEEHPLIDARGEVPFTWDTSSSPPTEDTNEDWIPTYDLNASAADIWEEKAADLPQDYDFNADGGSYTRSQVYEQHMKQARYFRSRRSPKTITQTPWPNSGVPDNIFNQNDPTA